MYYNTKLLWIKLFLSECNSDQLNISWPFLSSLLCGCNSKATPNPAKSDHTNGQEMLDWSELHSKRSNLLQNPYFTLLIELWKSTVWAPFHFLFHKYYFLTFTPVFLDLIDFSSESMYFEIL